MLFAWLLAAKSRQPLSGPNWLRARDAPELCGTFARRRLLTNIRVYGHRLHHRQRVARATLAPAAKRAAAARVHRTVSASAARRAAAIVELDVDHRRAACRDGSKRVNFVYSQNV
jgi:hypothetical protein